MSSDWYLNTNMNDRFSGFEMDEFNESINGLFDEVLNNSPEAYDVTVNGIAKKVIIQSQSDDANANKRFLLSKIGEIEFGDIVVHKGFNWLVVTKPDDDKINDHSEIQMCNNTMSIQTEVQSAEPIGYNDFGKPIYGTTIEYDNFPCIVESINEMYKDNESINLVDGKIALMIKNDSNPRLTVNKEFEMFSKTYKIYGFDRSKTLNDKGLLIVLADKI